MSPFTDDDLKQFKKHLQSDLFSGSQAQYEKALAFFTRLEAAEANMGGHGERCNLHECFCSKKDREEAWRRSCGK